MKLKVYGWQSFRNECKTTHRQTREICAATSMAAVARIAGVKRHQALFNICETHNPLELETALADPGVIYWRSISAYDEKYTKAKPKEKK